MGIWGSYKNIPVVIFYPLKGDYTPETISGSLVRLDNGVPRIRQSLPGIIFTTRQRVAIWRTAGTVVVPGMCSSRGWGTLGLRRALTIQQGKNND